MYGNSLVLECTQHIRNAVFEQANAYIQELILIHFPMHLLHLAKNKKKNKTTEY